MRKRVKFGGPFKGYKSSVPRGFLTPEYLATGSNNVLISPFDGRFFTRGGSLTQGDTVSVGNEVAGLLRAKWGAKSRQMHELTSPVLADGYPTYATLYTKETQANGDSALPAKDDGYFGQVYLRNTNAAAPLANYELLSEFSATHYPMAGYDATAGTGSTGAPHIFWPPMWAETGDGLYTRGATEFTGRFLAAGSRRLFQNEKYLVNPGLHSTPWYWDKRFNDDTASGSVESRGDLLGPLGSLWAPEYTGNSGNFADGQFNDGDTYYIAIVGEDDTGAFTFPSVCRPISATLPNGIGLVTVGAIAGANKYRYVTYSVPLMAPKIVRRHIFRSVKQKRATATDVLTISFDSTHMLYAGTLDNNTQTSYTDSLGNDAALSLQASVFSYAGVMPRRSRYIWPGDQRLLMGYSLPAQGAIQLAPLQISATARDMNAVDNSPTLYGNTFVLYRVTATALELYHYIHGGPGTLTLQATIDWATYPTIQDVLDQVNATTRGANAARWCAVQMPGVDTTAASSLLAPTTVDVTGVTCTINLPTIAGGDFTNVPLGTLVQDANFPAGTYLKSKQSANAATLSANATATDAVGHTTTFYSYCGDGATSGTKWHATKRGFIRPFSPTYKGCVYFKRSAISGYDAPDKVNVRYTLGSPSLAAQGQSTAINAWVRSNKLTPTENPGILMGGVDIDGASIVAYSKGWRLFTNRFASNTGQDYDYKLWTLANGRGLIAWDSLVGGHGWAAGLCEDGYMAIDVNRNQAMLSKAIFNPTLLSGDLAYEVSQCVAARGRDDDTAHMHAQLLGHRIRLSFRSSNGVTTPDTALVYDFSASTAATGLEELVNPDTREVFGWSSPLTLAPTTAIAVAKSGGTHFFGTLEGNAGGTGDGRIVDFDLTSNVLDDGAFYTSVAKFALLKSGAFARIAPLRVSVEHVSPAGSPNVDLTFSSKLNRSDQVFMPLASSGSDPMAQQLVQLPAQKRSPYQFAEFGWLDFGTAYGNGCFSAEFEYEETAN